MLSPGVVPAWGGSGNEMSMGAGAGAMESFRSRCAVSSRLVAVSGRSRSRGGSSMVADMAGGDTLALGLVSGKWWADSVDGRAECWNWGKSACSAREDVVGDWEEVVGPWKAAGG